MATALERPVRVRRLTFAREPVSALRAKHPAARLGNTLARATVALLLACAALATVAGNAGAVTQAHPKPAKQAAAPNQSATSKLACAAGTLGTIAKGAASAPGVGPGIGGLEGLAGALHCLTSSGGTLVTSLTRGLLSYLAAIPDYGCQAVTSNPCASTSLDMLSSYTSTMAFAALLVVLTIAIMRYWLSGLSSRGSGGMEALDGFLRTIFAAVMIGSWPWLFHNGVALANTMSQALLSPTIVSNALTSLFKNVNIGVSSFSLADVVTGNALNTLPLLVITVGMTAAFVGLLLMKIVISAMTTFLFVAMPIAFLLWPIEETAWLARTAGRSLLACFVVPIIWLLLFLTFAFVGVGALATVGSTGFAADSGLLHALVGLALMIALLRVPRQILNSAMSGTGVGAGRSFIGGVAQFAAGRAVFGGIMGAISSARGPQLSVTTDPATGRLTNVSQREAVRGRSAAGQAVTAAWSGSPAQTLEDPLEKLNRRTEQDIERKGDRTDRIDRQTRQDAERKGDRTDRIDRQTQQDAERKGDRKDRIDRQTRQDAERAGDRKDRIDRQTQQDKRQGTQDAIRARADGAREHMRFESEGLRHMRESRNWTSDGVGVPRLPGESPGAWEQRNALERSDSATLDVTRAFNDLSEPQQQRVTQLWDKAHDAPTQELHGQEMRRLSDELLGSAAGRDVWPGERQAFRDLGAAALHEEGSQMDTFFNTRAELPT